MTATLTRRATAVLVGVLLLLLVTAATVMRTNHSDPHPTAPASTQYIAGGAGHAMFR